MKTIIDALKKVDECLEALHSPDRRVAIDTARRIAVNLRNDMNLVKRMSSINNDNWAMPPTCWDIVVQNLMRETR